MVYVGVGVSACLLCIASHKKSQEPKMMLSARPMAPTRPTHAMALVRHLPARPAPVPLQGCAGRCRIAHLAGRGGHTTPLAPP